MNELTGVQVKYILVQANTGGEEERKQAVFYNEYNNSLTTVENVNQATKFDELEMVQGVASLQNQMAVIFGKPFTYSVVKEEITRTVVE
ncbi:hypothetical protein LZ578_08580 [Jeotgalibaca sp. MA1X17-3]|uniref:hypothetical protein n=1 Tax=Jeotgalibaca sp. MA1X17-3 TaxID=2908211 RepID=UPI001F3222EB|nr:hypothetical protein [Jeotgalibaca sp. MA1X17-3]UJF15054.1 hypothetical protein LZ578_08580 [Jeotgalibaca sp. MA1X17-3]